ncbi:ROK family transcriptional regulator [Microlunatus elymi]|uniref:ROK family transcriptional regulator n=1 Tax=Microlunatus elymi TaxID=2596828 RepID=A0A516Q149_9ACTN|nr:ROK family transcriptional regulator [Microlunatus elymi]QDP97147.1 ROK family transcriptional regulator [Microlunatus elymi]
MNDRAALHALVRRGPMSRIELEQEIGLSKPAAAELLRRLEEAELVRQDGHRTSPGPGPNARLWTVNEQAGHAVGADITATGFDVAVANLAGTVIGERRIASRGTGPDPLPALRRAVVDAGRAAGLRLADLGHAVVGISGSIDPVTGRLGYADHMPRWLGFDVPARLTEALGITVTVENDVNLVAVDELLHGCARGYRDAVLVWMSRGVAAAVIIDGRLHRGSRGGAGEIDRAPIDPDGHQLSDLIDARGVLALAQRHGIGASRASTAVRRAVAASAVRGSSPGDPEGFLGDLATRIARSVVIGVSLLDPQLVILAGDIGVAGGDRLADRVADRLHRMVAHRPEVRPGTGRDHAVRHGAVDAAVRQLQEAVFG